MVNFLRVTIFLMLAFGVSAKQPIVLGVSNATKGPSAQLGLALNQGAELYFNQLNKKKHGINGHLVELFKLNDGYEPDLTVLNTKSILQTEKTLALFNYVGTPTTSAIMPILESRGIPLLMPFTGADFLRETKTASVYNFRASYQQEAEAQVDYLVERLNLTNIALVIQADEFGLALEKYYVKALERHRLRPSVDARYRRNTKEVRQAFEQINKVKAEAVLFVGTYQPLAGLMKLAKNAKLDSLFVSVSFISSQELLKRVSDKQKVLVTEVVPNPKLCTQSVCNEFRVAAKEAGLSVNQVQFEGFLNAKLFATLMASCKKPNQMCLNRVFRSKQLNLGGIAVYLDELGNNRAAKVYATSQNLQVAF